MSSPKINPVLLEVTGNALLSIAEQMGIILKKTGYSTNIKERKDLSVGVFNRDGKLLALAQHIPLHFSSLFSAVGTILKKWDIRDIHDGDVFIANDPYAGGGSHLPDIVLVEPVFYGDKLIAFVVNIGHHADRTRRGSTIYDEGLRIPVVKLYEKGELVRDINELILLNMQLKAERKGDIAAQNVTNRFGVRKVTELCDKLGLDVFESFCDEWLAYGEKKARVAIANLPDGEYCFADFMDDDGVGREPIPIKVKITIDGERIKFDFTGSSPQVEGPYNCVKSALYATVYYAVKSLVDHTIPANSGYFDIIEIEAPEGTVVNSSEPAPTFDRETTTQRIADVIFGAFAQIVPEKVTAAGNGSVSFFSFSGYDRRNGMPYVYVETIGGGSGARAHKDGLDAVQVHMTNSSNLPVESLELEYPLIVETYALAEGSGGMGKQKGGRGIIRSIRLTDDSVDTMLIASVERAKIHPWGLFGGNEGACGDLKIVRNGVKVNDSCKVRGFRLVEGDFVEITTAGGGGYGLPA